MKKIFSLVIIAALISACCSCSPAKKATNVDVKSSILTEYRSVLIEKIYRYGNGKPDELPMYSLFDFDGDGTAEQLVWDIRVASSAFIAIIQ